MITKIKTYWKLGLINIISIVVYRASLKIGFIKKLTPASTPISGVFFKDSLQETSANLTSVNTQIFGWFDYSKIETPVWDHSVFSDQSSDVQHQHWSDISDFNLNIGDIKTVWELSRFDWLFYFVIEYLKTSDKTKLDEINIWLADWSKNNPANLGINWKCGQEASIRVMHLCMVALILDQQKTLSPALITMLEQHLERISPTIIYAMAQDNNHGTSEAVALYIGGLLLENNSTHNNARKWKNKGRYWIENRLKKLIMDDGTFSQYSVNYHRMMLDSICIAELFRAQFNEKNFSEKAIKKIKLATEWLAIFTNDQNGDAPVLGANDGAKLLPLTSTNYRDYRPSVQLATALFYNARHYEAFGTYDQVLDILKLNPQKFWGDKKQSKLFKSGGYAFLKNKSVAVYFKLPKFKFRPSQCDVFHLDLWVGCDNILRDAGSYSYNCKKKWQDYFPSTMAHNVVQFDNKEQMLKLSRFLYGNWCDISVLSDIQVKNGVTSLSAAYRIDDKIQHSRGIILAETELIVTDTLEGFSENAILRWRLKPDNYLIKNNAITSENLKISVIANMNMARIEIVKGYESRYYMQKSEIPVLEIEFKEDVVVTTKFCWKERTL